MSWAHTWPGRIATLGPIGHLRPAPGSWGSLAALPLAWGVAEALGWAGFVLALGVAIWGGDLAIKRATAGLTDPDQSAIVIDELAGQWIALLPVILGAAYVGAELSALWPGWIAAFLLFRLFDITKPGPIGRADARGDAWGVMLDDLIAGGFAALGVILLAAMAHLPLILA